jgi:3-deoxy-D-manno-octulosonic-acid transferase
MSVKGRFGGRWPERLGLAAAPPPQAERPRLMFHAASVGEAKSAAIVISAVLALAKERGLAPEIYLSVGTPAGIEAAEKALADERRVWVLAAPLDFWGSPARTLAALEPQALVIMETELWPNLIESAAKRGVKLFLAAARLSDRSFSRYSKIRRFMSRLLAHFDGIAAMGEHERDLYAQLGAAPEKLTVSGNPKFDQLISETENPDFQEKTRQWAEKIKSGNGPLIVAGSTHPGEEEVIVRAFEAIVSRHPGASLILAPRHLGRVGDLMAFLRGRNLPVTLSSKTTAPPASGGPMVILADQMGQLLSFYALAGVAIVGGSLLPGLKGHNPMEAAAAQSPMLFGPYMTSFAREAGGLLATGGAVETSAETLADDIEFWLKNPAKAFEAATSARQYLAGRGAVAPALAAAIVNLITAHEEAHV